MRVWQTSPENILGGKIQVVIWTGSTMAPGRSDRTSSVIVLGTTIILVQAAALLLLSRQWGKSFPLPRDVSWITLVRFKNEFYTVCESIDGVAWWACAIDVPSGKVRDSDLPPLLPWRGMVASETQIWVVSDNGVVESDGTKHVTCKTRRVLKSPLGYTFLFHGRPAIVGIDDEGVKYRLFVFDEAEWHDQGEVAIPGIGRTWIEDDATGQMVMQPLPGVIHAPATPHRIQVLTVGDVQHVFYVDNANHVVTYREGLDLLPDDADCVSALAPHNAAADTTGWMKLDLNSLDYGAIAHHDGKLVVVDEDAARTTIRFWERPLVPAGQKFELVSSVKMPDPARLILVEKPATAELFVIRDRHPLLQSFYRYHDGKLDELRDTWETTLTRFADWLAAVLGQIAAVLLLGMLLLVGGGEWIARSQDVTFEFGASRVPLASIWQRSLARGLDLALILAGAVFQVIHLGQSRIVEDALNLLQNRPLLDAELRRAIWISAIWACAILLVLIMTQARWGLTPGKWLCGVRVMRSTLRPCGFARSLLRELLFVLDAGALLTILPGMISLLISDSRQRLGDRMADTVVIRARELNSAN